jgi:hypothetical protein
MPGDDELHRQWLLGQRTPPVAFAPGSPPLAGSDAFGRLRTSEPVTLFDSQLQYDAQPLIWSQFISGSVGSIAHLPGQSSVEMLAGLNTEVVRQSRQYVRYQPGKSQLALMTFRPGSTGQDVRRRVGYFDANDGIFFEVQDTAAFFVLRTSVSGVMQETRVAQADWNEDRLDDSDNEHFNPSGFGLDVTRTQILAIDLEWLGVGTVRVGFVIDGAIRFVHRFHNANINTVPYMATANLPVRYEVAGGAGVTGTHGLLQICSTVISEGGFEYEQGFPFAATNGPTGTPVTNRRPVLSIRPQATFQGAVNRARILPENVDIYSDDQAIYWELVQGGVLTSGSFSPLNAHSVSEVDISATGIVGGIVIAGGYVAASSVGGAGATKSPGQVNRDFLSRIPLALEINGSHPTGTPSDILTLVASSRAGATDVSAALNWRELR